MRIEAGQVSTGSGYTTFKKKNTAEEAAERKRVKQIEARIRPDDKNYFISAKTFLRWKFDYIFTTKSGHGTGYFWDGHDSIKKLRGELIEEEAAPPPTTETKPTDSDANDDSKPKKKKRKKNTGPIIINDPNNPMEQVAAALQKRNQMLGLNVDPTLPMGWETARDPFSGKTYFFRRDTGERSWEKPKETETNSDSEEKTETLPEGWASANDKATGKTYYFHTNGETRWEKPSA